MPNDPRIIPLLDPTPTENEMLGARVQQSHVKHHESAAEYEGAVQADAARRADKRVRIAREAIEWAMKLATCFDCDEGKKGRQLKNGEWVHYSGGSVGDNVCARSRWRNSLSDHDAALAERKRNE